MSTITPPPANGPDPQEPASSRRPSRYAEMEQHELIHLLDEVNDERTRASFRESIYIALIIWLFLLALINYGPHYLRQPRVITSVRPEEQKQYTITQLPPDIVRKLPRVRPTPNLAERNQQSQSPQPSPESASPKAGTPNPPAPQQQPQPAPQQQQQPAPQPAPRPQQQPQLAEAPHPNSNQAPTKPIFNMGGSAGDQVQNAARNAARGGGEGGNYGNAPEHNGGASTGVSILSDTQGVDFNRYIQRLLAEIRRNWIPLIPEECSPPLSKSGVTGVRFTINPDGSILGMQLDYSTHDDAINRAAWNSIKVLGKAAPLPPEFHGPNLMLRIEFDVNKEPAMR